MESFAVLEPTADGFRNYVKAGCEAAGAEMLIDKAQSMRLSATEMTVLGGLRLYANVAQTAHGVFTGRPETFTTQVNPPPRSKASTPAEAGIQRKAPPARPGCSREKRTASTVAGALTIIDAEVTTPRS